MDTLSIAVAAVAGLLAVVAAVFSNWVRRRTSRLVEQREIEEQILRGLDFEDRAQIALALASEHDVDRRIELLEERLATALYKPKPSETTPPSTGKTQRPSSNEADDLKKLEARIADLESRLPSRATLPTSMSASEARIGVLIEHLERDLKTLESRTLSRGDVIMVVFAALSAIAALLAVIPWILERLAA
ncbi:hypothetical protein [Pseudactinotalea suaedae]|uniref:hypothetical protein n=1 Tax=Pseudactinotalea suaedae TaxID=1524924 RepID=UPI0012E19D70|nr:hypothetical protein [Pseudactinotalea suaedae]